MPFKNDQKLLYSKQEKRAKLFSNIITNKYNDSLIAFVMIYLCDACDKIVVDSLLLYKFFKSIELAKMLLPGLHLGCQKVEGQINN